MGLHLEVVLYTYFGKVNETIKSIRLGCFWRALEGRQGS